MGLGEALSLGSAAAWAVGVILYRRLGDVLPPLPLNFLKNLVVLALLVPTVVIAHGWLPPSMSTLDIALAVGSGFIGIAVADTLYLRALNELGAGRMGIVGNAYSPLVIVLGVLLLGERLNAWQMLGFALVTVGVLLVAKPPSRWKTEPEHSVRGALLGLLSVLLMAVAIIMVKRVLEQQPLFWVTLVRMIGAVLGMLLIASLRGELRRLVPKRPLPWRQLVTAALVGQYLAMLLWLGGYKYTDASVAAILNETSSAFIVLLAWLWLKERPTRRNLIGVTLALGGVFFMLHAGG
ncbi:MAG: DMT family transporter [Xanthomonadales bacterium]|nr:DMT family transporter [Xanthomonadales bacterium]